MKRLHALDTLRGVAALSIVVWHWQHFFSVSGHFQEGWQRSAQPFYAVLKPLYEAGWLAVDLFFALSGFVFHWLYADAIRERAICAGKFAWLRFSRLYPLHLLTLLAVVVLQYSFHDATGSYFIFDANDLGRFASSLILAQQWLPPTIEQTFNGPAWSVSTEVLLYGIFFVLCRAGLRGFWQALLVAALAVPFLWWNEFIARGAIGFFLGGAAFTLTSEISARTDAKLIARALCIAALALWAVTVLETYLGPLHAWAYWLSGRVSPDVGRWYIANSGNVFLLLFVFTVSPLTVMALALHEQVLGGKWERLSFLGDISYSTYMLHFPMQLALALIAARFALTPVFFENGFALIAFYAVLIGLGAMSFNAFERPMQSLLRKFLVGRLTSGAC
jgi:peptidoglycan/LPS O-acetylase OafA/YrhL